MRFICDLSAFLKKGEKGYCGCRIFFVPLQRFICAHARSAIEAHRTRSASWKRSMPPLSPLTHEVRGGPVKRAPYAKRSFDRKGDKNIARGKRILKQTTWSDNIVYAFAYG